VDKIRSALASDDASTKVCFASDATVVAVAQYSDDKFYSPIPIVASPSDKTEKADDLAKWMKTILDAWKSHEFGEKINGPIWSLASDGDSTYRAAKFKICMEKIVEADSNFGKVLHSLLGLNKFASKDGITLTGDPKHIFKRFATLLRSLAGFMINQDEIKPSDIAAHLAMLPDMDVKSAWQLLDPADKQNVPKAVTLLQSLLQLKDLPTPENPAQNQKRKAIIFAAQFMGYFMRPFTDVDMNLNDQLENLVTYSFLAAAMQIRHGTNCLTSALYADTQATVKNIIFTVARMQRVDTKKALYLLLEGTDRLEGLFGDCRTQDHSRNFDIEQLGQKLGVATLIHSTMQRNQDLDMGHRRLSLKNTMGVDHINPKSWRGTVKVGDIDLNIVWKKGELKAKSIFEGYYKSRINFDKQFSKDNHDLLRPEGDYVGVNYSPNDARSEEENPDPLSHYTNSMSAGTLELPEAEADGDTYDHELGVGLEDLLPETQEGIETDAEPLAFTKKITHEGKEVMKSSLIATLNNSKSKKVPWRTWRVRNVAIDDLYNSKREEMYSDDMEDEEYLKKGDLAAALVRSGGEICLCAIEVKEFQFGTEKATHVSAALSDLEDVSKAIKVTGQIIALVPSTTKADF
jgi:hypothetical protein